MSFYYTREPGAEGQILADQGEGSGRPLSDVLDRGPLPIRAVFELIGALADVLTVAEEDNAIHGDIKPGFVRVDSAGAVTLEGYGEPRRGGRAPEGEPVGVATDTYGLGVLMYTAMTAQAIGAIPKDYDGHDDTILQRLAGVDWSAIQDKRWFDEVLHFLCSMLAFDPSMRPHPLDVANIFVELSHQIDGEDLVDWARDNIQDDRRGRPRGQRIAEDLGGPTSLSGPISNNPTGGFRIAASAKGESTAFWSKEKIAAMLAAEDEQESEQEAPRRESWSPAAHPPPEPAPHNEPLRNEPLRNE
ncbi:MAG: hypothetical protein AAFV53_34325, partial [Myxococcota bacterium]